MNASTIKDRSLYCRRSLRPVESCELRDMYSRRKCHRRNSIGIHYAPSFPFHFLQASTKPSLAAPSPAPSPPHAPGKPEPESPPTIPIGTILTLPCAHMNGKAHFPNLSTRSTHSGTLNTSLNMTADLQALELSISRSTFGQVPSRRSQECSP
jgi:hypothetical protein